MDLTQFGNSDAINIILMVAVKKAETTVIEHLIDQGANMNAKINNIYTIF